MKIELLLTDGELIIINGNGEVIEKLNFDIYSDHLSFSVELAIIKALKGEK